MTTPWARITPTHAQRLTHSSMFIWAYSQTHPPFSLKGPRRSQNNIFLRCNLTVILNLCKHLRTWREKTRRYIEKDLKGLQPGRPVRTAEQHQSPKNAPKCNPARLIISKPEWVFSLQRTLAQHKWDIISLWTACLCQGLGQKHKRWKMSAICPPNVLLLR